MSPEEFKKAGYRAVDLLAERFAKLQNRALPMRQPVGDDLRHRLMFEPLPAQPLTTDEILDQVAELILAHPMGNSDARFFGWINSTAAPIGIIAELLSAGHNASVAGGGGHSAIYVEHGVLNWFKSIFGYPQEAGGLFVSGGSVANLVALGVMRHVHAQHDMREQGFQGQANAAPMVIYTSAQGHLCIQKAIESLGFGNAYLRRIEVDGEYRLNVSALRAQIEADLAAGLRPVCVAANAGTVNTGAIDPLEAIAAICEQYKLWFHVDGAYGGIGILSPEIKHLFKGIEHADSIAVDPHKWMFMPIECGCVLVKDAAAMRATYSVVPSYIQDNSALAWFSEFGLQQTRGFKALKLWMTLQQIGQEGFRDLITGNITLAKALTAKIEAHPHFEVVATGDLSINCFRYVNAARSLAEANQLNRSILETVQEEGNVFLTGTELDGQFALRACIVNFRTTEADLDFLLDTLAHAGARLSARN